MIEILNIDCMEYMATLDDNAFELAIVDPPYGLPKKSCHGRGQMKGKAFMGMAEKGWDIAPDKSYFDELFRVSEHQIIWGGNHFGLPPNRGFAVWDKMQPWPNFSAAEYAWCSIDGPSKIFKYDCRRADKIHPTQKPIKHYDWLLEKYAKEGDRILDTHLGSGSSAIAAHYAGFDFVGTEIDEDYYNAATERFDTGTAQLGLAL